jgi:hypothetical protein
VLAIFFAVAAAYSLVGVALFAPEYRRARLEVEFGAAFTTPQRALLSMFVLSTTEDYPGVMYGDCLMLRLLPAQSKHGVIQSAAGVKMCDCQVPRALPRRQHNRAALLWELHPRAGPSFRPSSAARLERHAVGSSGLGLERGLSHAAI